MGFINYKISMGDWRGGLQVDSILAESLVIIHPSFSSLVFRILLGKLRISRHAGGLGDVIFPSCVSLPITSTVEAVVSHSPDTSHGPHGLPNHPLGDEGPPETHGRSQGPLDSITRSLPDTAERIQSGLAEVRVVPVIEEVVGLLSGSQLLGLQPFLPPLSVDVCEETGSD